MIRVEDSGWDGLEGFAEEELERMRAPAELAVDRAARHLEAAVKRTLGPAGGARSGRWYVVPRSSFKGAPPGVRNKPRSNPTRHQASAPGEPPARLYGDLARSITHSSPRWEGWTVSSEVGTAMAKARRLEYGGVDKRGIRLLARPYFAPTVLREEAAMEAILDKAVTS